MRVTFSVNLVREFTETIYRQEKVQIYLRDIIPRKCVSCERSEREMMKPFHNLLGGFDKKCQKSLKKSISGQKYDFDQIFVKILDNEKLISNFTIFEPTDRHVHYM